MASRAVSIVAYYRAWDTSANAWKTGDSANHTLYWTKDGTASATTNSPAEVDSTNRPGLYKVTLTSTETDCLSGSLGGKSSTSNIFLFGDDYTFSYDAADSSGLVNVGKINSVAATSVTAINANLGTTQPVNFTGTSTSALMKSDMVDVAGAAVSTSAAQIGVNMVNVAGTAQTAADIGAIFASNGVETGYALKDALRLMFSALCAKVSGLPGSPVFRDVPDSKDRITATTDSNGNRSAVTLDAT